MSNIIEVKGLTKRFGENIVLDNVSFDVEEGSIIGLIGKSGCGKTTLLNTLVGFIKPNKGTISYKGTETHKLGNELKRKFGFAAQEGSFYKNLTVEENLAYFGKLYGVNTSNIKERTQVLLEIFGLNDADKIFGNNLSIGMQKRLDIACSLIHDPEILLLDEPTANLDPTLRKNILDLVKEINASGTTVILSSHLLDDIKLLCNKVLMIDNKRIVAYDTPQNLELNVMSPNIIKLESELKDYGNLIAVLTSQGLVKDFKTENSALTIFTTDVKNALKHINDHYSQGNDNLVHIDVIKPNLDKVFEDKST